MFRRGGKLGRGAGAITIVDIEPDAPPEAPEDPPSNITVPTIAGDLSVNGTLSTTGGTWSSNPDTLAYQWKRTGTDITGADDSFYEVTADDVGSTLTVTVTATNAFGTASATSVATSTVAGVAPANTVDPAISGGSDPPVVGETLSSSTGTWTGTPIPVFTYQWKAGGVNITGATNSTYLLTTAEEGDTITCAVTATNSAGNATDTTAATSAVVAATPATVTLTNLSVNPVSSTTASISVDSNRAAGVVYWVVVPSAASAPSAAQVKAGTDGAGNAATWASSLSLSSISTMDVNGGPSGLSGGVAYKAYAAQQDTDDTYSAVVNDAFTSGSIGAAPGLSSQDATPGADDRWIDTTVTTDEDNGTIFVVAVPNGDTTPLAQNIADGQRFDGTVASSSGSISISSSGAKTKTLTGLIGGTTYLVAWVHRDAAGNFSNIVTDTATTDTLILSRATAGTSTGLNVSTGVSAFSLAYADSDGGTNAISWTDNGDAGSGAVRITTTSSTFYSGVVKFRGKMKAISHTAAKAWVRFAVESMTGSGSAWFNLTDGAVGTETAVGTPTITSLGSSWYQLSASIDLTGSDIGGLFTIHMGDGDNDGTMTRDGNNSLALYDLRVTRAS
jgi:hypothetical protein